MKPKVIHSYEGFDGGNKIEKFTENFVMHIDLSRPFYLKKTFDWIMSLEVGEHIPQQYEDTFIDNMIRHCKKGIIISWAIPNQPGRGHVNLKSNEYIIKKMKEKNLIHDIQSQNYLRRKTSFKYLKTNIMVFRKY
ncbi:hypothetical protein Avbf_04233 [Armadillidium vulgare]|nr:hypothetical protein Avbf_04233 [Armadillidium vulgare]